MTQTSGVSFSLTQSGQPFQVQNHLLGTSSVTIAYTINGAPATLTVVVEGMQNNAATDLNTVPGPVIAALDSYSGTTNTTRTITLSGALSDWFQITAYWTGGAANGVSVACVLTATGAGPVFNSNSLSAVQTIAGA